MAWPAATSSFNTTPLERPNGSSLSSWATVAFSQMPETVTDLHILLLEHLRRTVARLPTRNPDYDPSKPESGTYKM